MAQCPGAATNVVVTHTIDPAFTLGPATASQGTVGVELNAPPSLREWVRSSPTLPPTSKSSLSPLNSGTFTNRVALSTEQGPVTTLNIELPVSGVAPELTFTLSQDALTFSWPASATGFVVEQSESLAPPIQWVPVSVPPILVGDQRVLSLQPTNSAVFYRLQSLP